MTKIVVVNMLAMKAMFKENINMFWDESPIYRSLDHQHYDKNLIIGSISFGTSFKS